MPNVRKFPWTTLKFGKRSNDVLVRRREIKCHFMVVLFRDAGTPGGVRHGPQRFMGKTVTVPHFNRDTVEFVSRTRNESNPGIKTLLPFPKNITEESDFENFQDLIVALDACDWLHKAISRSLSRFGDDRAI